jgi:hypothetical protein
LRFSFVVILSPPLRIIYKVKACNLLLFSHRGNCRYFRY